MAIVSPWLYSKILILLFCRPSTSSVRESRIVDALRQGNSALVFVTSPQMIIAILYVRAKKNFISCK